jgi:hypothetical protein
VSRVVWSRAELERDAASNDGTRCLRLPDSLAFSAAAAREGDESFEALFRCHYAPLRALLSHHEEPGLAVLVVTGVRLEATAWLAAHEDDIHSLVVGRHSACDVFLPGDEALSLRHLALLLRRRSAEGAGVRYRVCDLRTSRGFRDENGRRLEALESEGPLLLRCASFSVLLFPTPAGAESWPDGAEQAWLRIPERTYLEAAEPDAARPPVRALARESEPRQAGETLATTFPGPCYACAEPDVSDPATGELLIETPAGCGALGIGPRAGRRGILLGRYERCDGAAFPLASPDLSRVHALVVDVDRELHLIDTCSKNGAWAASRRVRSLRLRPGVTIVLAGRTRISWRPFH